MCIFLQCFKKSIFPHLVYNLFRLKESRVFVQILFLIEKGYHFRPKAIFLKLNLNANTLLLYEIDVFTVFFHIFYFPEIPWTSFESRLLY